jgi:thiamine monophosphate kinase
LYGGEEYNLIYTFPSKYIDEIKKSLLSIGSKLILIGNVTEKKDISYQRDGEIIQILPKGWEHFKK